MTSSWLHPLKGGGLRESRGGSLAQTPRLFVRAALEATQETAAQDFTPFVRPEGYDYNKRQVVIEGVAHYLLKNFNGGPLQMIGVQKFPRRILIAYLSDSYAPSIIFQIRNRTTGRLLQEVFVKNPLVVYRQDDYSIKMQNWSIAREGISTRDGNIYFDIIQEKKGEKAKDKRFFRYSLVAPWRTEDLARTDLPAHLDHQHYGSYALSSADQGGALTEKDVIGQWISEPSGALWEFKSDHTITFNRTQRAWRITDGALSIGHEAPLKSRATFRVSRSGKHLEVTWSDAAGPYEPFVIRRR